MLAKRVRIPRGFDPPVDKEQRAMAHAQRFGDVVIGENDRGSCFGALSEQRAQSLRACRVNPGKRLVAHEHLGTSNERTS